MSISEVLSQAAVTQETIKCPRNGAHSTKCVCLGTGFIKACVGCEGSGWNARMQKVCGPCGGTGMRTASKPT